MSHRLLLTACLVAIASVSARAEPWRGVLELQAEAPADARTAATLGQERTGSATLIDGSGLAVTISYLVMETSEVRLRPPGGAWIPARVEGIDLDSGLAVLRLAARPEGIAPLPLGQSRALAPLARLSVVAGGGPSMTQPALLADKRPFAGYWEYLLEEALFTAPPHPAWSGAALVDAEGRLVGIGSLIVPDALASPPAPGNMFVPVDLLRAGLADLLALGRGGGAPRPWIGVTLAERAGRLTVLRVSDEGPAALAGVRPGDQLVGVGGRSFDGLADFYRKLWASGPAGAEIPLSVLRRDGGLADVSVRSIDRTRWLKTDRGH